MRWLILPLLSLVLLSLAGCSTTGEPAAGLAAQPRLRSAIALLQTGKAEPAKAELRASLVEESEKEIARNLLWQIEADPVSALGNRHIVYTVKTGDTLSAVAERMLGDKWMFYILARYNGIENPSRIKAGQTIRVPNQRAPAEVRTAGPTPKTSGDTGTGAARAPESGDKSAPAARQVEAEAENVTQGERAAPEPDEEEPRLAVLTPPARPVVEAPEVPEVEDIGDIEALLGKAQKLADAGDYEAAAGYYARGLDRFPGDELIRGFAVSNYLAWASKLGHSGQYDRAAAVLTRAAEIDPKSAEIPKSLAIIERQDEADQLYDAGRRYLGANKPLEAYGAFKEAVEIAPDNKLAKAELKSVTPTVMQRYHRLAMAHFRRRELDEAIATWDKGLAIDPAHGPSLLYRAEALELKEGLDKTTSGQ